MRAQPRPLSSHLSSSARKRVLVLTQGDLNLASSRFRVYQYLDKDLGVNAGICFRVVPLPARNLLRRVAFMWKVLWISPRNDILFLQKLLLPSIFFRFLRIYVGRVVYDWDDALYTLPPGSKVSPRQHRKRVNRLNTILSLSDTVICGNQILGRYAANMCSDVRIIPTSVNIGPVISRDLHKRDVITIGWIGRSENLQYLSQISGVFKRLYLEFGDRLQLKVICNEPFHLDSPLTVVNETWSLSQEEKHIASFDIGIMPLEDTEWARGKCAFKLLQYMALGVPAVGSPVGANLEVISHEENGLLASTESEWVECLSRLIVDNTLRTSLALAARETVKNRFSVQITRGTFLDALMGN